MEILVLYYFLKVDKNEYDLILQNDINTKGNTQWFYFSVSNTRKNNIVRFNIVNYVKKIIFNQIKMKQFFFAFKVQRKSSYTPGNITCCVFNKIIRTLR